MTERDYSPTRQEILDRYGWGENERDMAERDMADRQRRIEAETRAAEASRQREPGQQQPPADTTTIRERRDKAAADVRHWKKFIRDEIVRNGAAAMRAIAKAIYAEEKARRQDVDEARSHYRDICARFSDHPRYDEIAKLRQQVAALQERIDSLEKAAPQPAGRPLKAVG